MAILDYITPADLKPRIDVIKNILNSALVDQKPLDDQKVKAIVAAIIDISNIIDENEDKQEDLNDSDMQEGMLIPSLSKSSNQLNLL